MRRTSEGAVPEISLSLPVLSTSLMRVLEDGEGLGGKSVVLGTFAKQNSRPFRAVIVFLSHVSKHLYVVDFLLRATDSSAISTLRVCTRLIR